MLPTISLFESEDLGLILPFPSGVIYSNQCGGTSCQHPGLEGVYVPLLGPLASSKLQRYFEAPPHDGSGATSGLSEKDAQFIDASLAAMQLGGWLHVDRARLRESMESWVHVNLQAEGDRELRLLSDFGSLPESAVLTWPNSD